MHDPQELLYRLRSLRTGKLLGFSGGDEPHIIPVFFLTPADAALAADDMDLPPEEFKIEAVHVDAQEQEIERLRDRVAELEGELARAQTIPIDSCR